MICPNCGNTLEKNAKFCPKCGLKIENNNLNNTNPKNKIIFIIGAVVLIVLAIVAVYFLGKNKETNPQNTNSEELTNNENTTSEEEKNEEEEYTFNLFDVSKIIENTSAADSSELTKNIEIYNLFFNPKSTDYGKTRDVYIYGKNNNSQVVDIKIILEFYDKEGYRIEKKSSFDFMVSANKEFVTHITVPNDSLDYNSVKMTYEAKTIKTYEKEIPLEKLEYSHNKLQDGSIDVVIKNNSDTKINSINFACLYYKNGKAVFAQDRTSVGLEANQSDSIKFYEFQLRLNNDYKNPEKIEYDDYKVFPYSATFSDSKNY